MELWFADKIFRFASEREIKYLSVSDEEITKLGRQIDLLYKVIRSDYNEDHFLQNVYVLIRNYFFNFTTSLVPFHEMINVDLLELRLKLREVKAGYSDIYYAFLQAAQLIKGLQSREDNPLLNQVIHLLQDYQNNKIAIVTRRSLKEEELSILLSNLGRNTRDVKLFNEGSFKKAMSVFDYVLFIGSEQYFQPFSNNIPMSKRTTFLSYDVFRNQFQRRNLFSGFEGSFSNLYEGTVVTQPDIPSSDNFVNVKEEKIASHLIQLHLSRYDEDSVIAHEPVEACIVSLESDYLVLLQKGIKYKIVDPDSDKKIVLKSVGQMEIDDYLLIYTERESSIIATIADQLVFKEKAESYRKKQKHWKHRLEKLIEKYGLNTASRILNKAGVETAKPYNLKNWLKESTISPRDLDKILTALKYSPEDIKKIIHASNLILSGHLKAGNIISRKAEEVIKNADLKKLITNGTQTFEIPEFVGATFMVDRIVGIGKNSIKVHHNRIMQLYELNEFN
ncbi:hypothetical protein QNK12_15140 [Neobacillus cucumis]|nr:hypothetical protein QNK12_15140 [Neobacillus cucumis]